MTPTLGPAVKINVGNAYFEKDQGRGVGVVALDFEGLATTLRDEGFHHGSQFC